MSREREAAAGIAPPAQEEKAARQSAAPVPATPEDWAGKIVALHDAGDLAAAAAQLRDFRGNYPGADGYLPGRLQTWAASVTSASPP